MPKSSKSSQSFQFDYLFENFPSVKVVAARFFQCISKYVNAIDCCNIGNTIFSPVI